MLHGKAQSPWVNSDMTAELQSLSTQLYYILVMMLSDQALEIVRNSPEGNGAEVWRKLLWQYELVLVSDTERCCNHC